MHPYPTEVHVKLMEMFQKRSKRHTFGHLSKEFIILFSTSITPSLFYFLLAFRPSFCTAFIASINHMACYLFNISCISFALNSNDIG